MVFINFNNNKIKINANSIKELKNIVKLKLNINNFYLVHNGRILLESKTLDYYNIYDNSFIDVNLKLNGGVMEIFEAIFSPILNPFKDMILAIVSLLELLFEMIGLFFKLFKVIPVLFNPDKLINDVIYGITNLISSLINGFVNQFTFNESKSNNGNSGLFGIEDNSKKICIKPTLFNLILLVLCPPLALYIDRGFKGFFLVIVCALLTYYLYYFPGFLFAALHILC